MEEEGDGDITMFQQSDTSHLGNIGDDTIQENENNVTEENHVQVALVQQSQSCELGNARTYTNKSGDLNLETQLPMLDDDAFYTAYAFDSDIGNSGVPSVRTDSIDDGVVETFFYCDQSFDSAKAVKERVREHSIETRRELLFLKNDKKE
jgi:hypothetical protein